MYLADGSPDRNEGGYLNSGQKLWKRAYNIIPGGNMLLSKRPEMFAPNQWPTYYSKAKGCNVWDLDNTKYIDMSLMSVGTNILGYSNNHVNNAVVKAITKSNMSSLNCFEEVLGEKLLICIHTLIWRDMLVVVVKQMQLRLGLLKLHRAGQDCNLWLSWMA